jgi:two-component system sporulation sensor kinase B
MYDFRSVPVIIGALYGGPIVSILLFCTLVLYRYILANPNNLLYCISILPILLIVNFALRRFSPLKVYQKIIVSVILCTFMKLITISLYLSFIGKLNLLINHPIETLKTYFIQGVIIGLCVYLIEMLNKYFHLQDEVYKSEKIKMVSEMAASVAHEIRNPLTTVRGFIQLLGSANLEKDKKEYYQKICLDELNRAELIITDYLSIAKPDPEMIENITINDEINYLSNVLMTYANFNNIEINAILSEDLELHIIGDKYKFRQALINVGKNGIEAMPNGGVLEIKAKKLDKNIVISISDTGIGMAPEQIKRMGTPYYSTKEKGTGLGTMVSFLIIKKMNGQIDIKSKLGKGTEYTFIFPGQYRV